MRELLLVAADTPAGLWCLGFGDGRLRHADHQSAKHPQDQRRIGIAHSAAIFIQGDVQRMMQSALDDPIAPFEFDPAQCVQLLGGQAADQIHRFGGFVAFAPHATPQSRNEARSGKTDLFRADFPALQNPNLTPAPIVFACQGSGLLRGLRGKICPASGALLRFGPVPSGCP